MVYVADNQRLKNKVCFHSCSNCLHKSECRLTKYRKVNTMGGLRTILVPEKSPCKKFQVEIIEMKLKEEKGNARSEEEHHERTVRSRKFHDLYSNKGSI